MTKNISNNIKESKCSGCGVCVVICPTKSIDLKKTEDGFWGSYVNNRTCINCTICQKVCPHLNKFSKSEPIKSFIAREKKSIYKEASSAGICSSLADYYLDKGYYACGAYYNYDNNHVEHFITNNKKDYEKAQGSKYLQSNTIKAFKNLLNNFNDEKKIVFGSPCQIAGIRNYLKLNKKEENYILIDFFCHGVPSYLLWENYLKYNNIDKMEKVIFRKKTPNEWRNYCMSITIQGITKDSFSKNNDLFHRFFLFDTCLNNTCVKSCEFYGANSSADLRVGDCWNKNIHKDNRAMSSILVYDQQILECLHSIDNLDIEIVSNESLTHGQPKGIRKNGIFRNIIINGFKKGINIKLMFYIFVFPKLVWSKFKKMINY